MLCVLWIIFDIDYTAHALPIQPIHIMSLPPSIPTPPRGTVVTCERLINVSIVLLKSAWAYM